MSEFKFSCPNCQQRITATSEYSGLQINCPSCKALLVVPTVPGATPAPSTPSAPDSLVPVVPSGTRLSVAASAPDPQPAASAAAAASFYAAKPTRKKKPKTGLIVGLSVAGVALAATIYFWPDLMKKVSSSNQATAAAEAATNAPPPPPPELTTEEILLKVGDTYKGLTDYAAKAQTVGTIDMSGVAPGQKPVTLSTSSTLQLGRTNSFRLEWEQKGAGVTTKGAAWNAGKGNFVGYGPYQPTKVKSREAALAPAAQAFILSDGIVELFFSETNSFADQTKDFTKTNSPNLNAGDSYVLAGEVPMGDVTHLGMLLWVNKQSFLITQMEATLGEPVDEVALKKLPLAQRNQMAMLAKLKGTITETYSSIQINQHLLASAFESAYKPAGNPAGNRGGNRAGAGGQRQQGPGSRAEMLTQPGSRRRMQQQQQ